MAFKNKRMFRKTQKSQSNNNRSIEPFLKWAGGKRQLIKQIDECLPLEFKNNSLQRYIEPFVGGGAVLFYIAQYYQIEEFFIFDINPELIIAYKTIKNNVDDLLEILAKIETEYLLLNEEKRKEYFYQTRSQFNNLRKQSNPNQIQITALLIFLNRTCFNGLFRVNSKGDFNVPCGKYKNPTICNSANLKAVSNILQKTHIQLGDFSECQKYVNSKSFVYFDPPYKPISKTSNFTAYAKDNFDDREQLRLRDFFTLLDRKGAKLMLSNSDADDGFFANAYSEYSIKKVQARRNINSNAQKRGKINEILIMNYSLDCDDGNKTK